MHQRGRRIAAFSFISLGGYQLAPVLSGHLADTYGWRTSLWILVAFYGVAVLLVVFALPETDYKRPLRYERDIAPEEAEKASGSTDGGLQTGEEVTIGTDVEATSEHEEQLRSYLKELLPCRRIHAANPLPLILRYFSCILYPIVWYAFLVC